MLPERHRLRQARRVIHAVAALCVSAALLGLLAFGYGTIPALGPALDPGHGAWTSAAGGKLPRSQTLTLPGLAHPVAVAFTSHGVASIRAAGDRDAFLALGYAHATFRLTEMDLERRLGEGRLAQLAGPSALASDKFELRLGLLRTAQREWAETPRSSPAGQALIWYSRGVNDYLAQVRASRQWPALFSLAGVYPANWTPVDSLVIQGDLTQELDYTTTPLDYALLEHSLGAARTMAWFPVRPASRPSPYDPGPYRNRGIAPIVTNDAITTADTRAPAAGPAPSAPPGRRQPPVTARLAKAASALLAQARALPAGQIHRYPDSNAWAVNGPKDAAGGAMLAGDPHLPQTLPSVWYQVAISAPGLAVSGVSVPGLPGILLGHNSHIAWSLTDVQNQSTLFYQERTSRQRPGQYYWRGQWRRMTQVHYAVPVRGGPPVRLTVEETVHGPVMTQAGQTMSVDWMGNVPSPDLAVMLAVDKARDFAQFRAALASWRAPTQNFVFADDRGHIGAISAGYYPLVRHGDPWLPLPGTGADDVAGVIPYASVPQVYDPAGHVVATANQRPVTSSYPYYIGTTANDFDPGYRAAEEYSYLRGHDRMKPASFAVLQTSLTDQLASTIVPELLAALRGAPLSQAGQQAALLLSGWNYSMGPSSAAASVWWTFWTDYLSAVFQPWWTQAGVPARADRLGLKISPGQFSLDQVLQAWTRSDQRNPAFTPPGRPRQTARTVMRSAFGQAVAHLRGELGGAPASWAWGRLHSRRFPSLTQAAGLGYGPRAAGGDPWTVDAAEGGMVSTAGPSWRMIAQLGGRPGAVRGASAGASRGSAANPPSAGDVTAAGIYPGGQSENPASPWYADQIAGWWNGTYLPMPPAGGYATGPIRWALRPAAHAQNAVAGGGVRQDGGS
jgi:penicillin G amidase